ncbi:MAG: hypothetical protein IH616_20675, partial [Gemmatimonadales bacterium]|nr:hypothetical protein [Gemmatimonadales bacterium]
MTTQPEATGAARGHARTRWRLLAVIAVVVLIPTAAIAGVVTREPAEPIPFPFALGVDGAAVDLGIPTGGSG